MKIVFATSEVVPFAKTGGLADISGALPKELAKLGCDVRVFMPKYFSIDESLFDLQYVWGAGEMSVRVAGIDYPAHVYKSYLSGSKVEIYFIDCPHYFNRHEIYTKDDDEDERFILFSKAVVETCRRLKWSPDVFHCNDWQTGLIPLFIKDNSGGDGLFKNSASVFTIHNIGYQGNFNSDVVDKAEIKKELYYPYGPIEFYNKVSFLKTGINFSDVISTVSQTYAKEILTQEFGGGMESILLQRKNDLFGILNGVDYSVWSPETDEHLPYHYSSSDLSGKLKNKKYLLKHLGLPFNENVPVIGIVSRLVTQKGFDLIAESINTLIKSGAQWVILGSGETEFEELFIDLANRYPKKVSAYIGYNNELSHLIEAGSDMFLMPSHFEPCGLNQIYSLKYGTVPMVRKTGGLADTVRDYNEDLLSGKNMGNGFSFEDYNKNSLVDVIERAITYFKNKVIWRMVQINGMKCDYSWEKSALEYLALYQKAVKKKVG